MGQFKSNTKNPSDIKVKYLLLLTLFFPSLLIGQNTVTGTIISSKTKASVAFATVGLLRQNIGISADDGGKFELISPQDFQNDTLRISSVGFESLSVPVKDFKSPVILQEKDSVLKEIVVISKKDWKTGTLNDFKKCTGDFFYTSSGSQTQVALHLQLPSDKGYLQEIRMCTGRVDFREHKNFTFRIRAYGVDTLTGGPGADLSEQNIEVTGNKKEIVVNLRQYNILVPDKDFFIALEWLKTPSNEYRGVTTVNGTQKEFVMYNPTISCTIEGVNSQDIWHQYYNGEWKKNQRRIGGDIRISATVKY